MPSPADRVRPPRRPEGWEPPGPPAAGPGDRADLWPAEGEDLCFVAGGWRIFQRLDGHRTSLDDLATAWYASTLVEAPGAPGRILDLGCGVGSVLLRLAWSFPAARVVGVEAQAVSVGLARRSVAYDGASRRCEVREGDLRDTGVVPEAAAFELVTGTPPYLPMGAGVVSGAIQKGPCRFEHRGGIEDYCVAAARALVAGPRGRFAVCHNDPPRTEAAAAAAGLVILRRRDVIPRTGRRVLFTLFAMTRAGAGAVGEPIAEAPLVVRDEAGAHTADYLAIRAAMGMPPAAARPR